MPHRLKQHHHQGSVLILVLAALFIVGILLERMSEQAILDDQLTDNFVKFVGEFR